jgi:tol-pal system protein YbgF
MTFRFCKLTLTAATLFAAVCVQAQVDVVESTPMGGGTLPATQVGPVGEISGGDTAPPLNAAAKTFYQLQLLQQEVLELRGLLEEQAFQLKRLKQQRTDDYLDLDRRLSALTGGGSSATTGLGGVGGSHVGTGGSSVGISGTQSTTPVSNSTSASGGEEEASAYRAAYDLLKQRQVDAAITAFSDLLIDHPEGKYAANAHYWLGEIFLLKNDLESSRQWFTRLLDGFPGHRKVPDAQFKLGKVYHLMGDLPQARSLLDTVAASNADSARLARKYLEQNFQ